MLLLSACDPAAQDDSPPSDDAALPASGATEESEPEGGDSSGPGAANLPDDDAVAHAPTPEPASDPAPAVPPPEPEPLEIRKTRRAIMIYPEPAVGESFRGKLPHGEAFAVYEHVQAPGCRGPWGRVAVAGYVCLDYAEATDKAPAVLPRLPGSRLVPFFYAKNRNDEEPAPVWRSRRAMRDGAEPIGTLDPDHVYAFSWRRRTRGGGYLSDHKRRTVSGADVKKLEPSDFGGRELTTDPIPEGQSLAWTLQWPRTPVYAEADPESEVARHLPYHVEVYVKDTPVRRRGIAMIELADGTGWLSARESRRYLPVPPRPQDVGPDQPWLDIELDQQTLTVMHGDRQQFVTLISSGTWKDPTPTGIYRLEGKMALSDMRSRTGDDEAYHVEDVPWVMYFKGRYALHGAYWHNRFGRRTSHGCVNLSAKDARRVYTLTEPHVPPGWVMAFEHAEALGTVIRIRRGDRPVVDKRRDP